MTLREFIGEERLARNYVGKPDHEIWDTEITDADVERLKDEDYLDRLEEGHKEMMAWMTARHGSSIYPPEDLPAFLGKFMGMKDVPLLDVYALYGLRGNQRTGTY